MIDDPIICDNCGGHMVPGVPGDVHCPNDACLKESLQEAMRIVKHSEKLARRKQYEELKKEFDNE